MNDDDDDDDIDDVSGAPDLDGRQPKVRWEEIMLTEAGTYWWQLI